MMEARLSSRSRDGLRIVGRGAVAALVALPVAVAAAGPPAGVSPDEWAGIEQQIEAEHHKVTESDRPGRLWCAANPAQRFTAHFGAEDVLLVPAGRGEPAWHLGLRLTSWGGADDLQPVNPAGAIAEGNRVEYRRGPLTEWYVNTTGGLEQGFTIDAPPGDDIDELVLEMTLDGGLTPELAEDGRAVTFQREGSTALLAYSGLAAWDAAGEPLEARMELAGGRTRLRHVVSVAGAAWPVTVDPIFTQVAKLLPTPRLDTWDSYFGRRVAVDGDLMVVALDDPERGDLSGSAYIFERHRGGADTWGQVAKITPAAGAERDSFARSVSISGDTVIAGAPGDAVNGPGSGSVYIFRRDEGGLDAWGQAAKIHPTDGSGGDGFGVSVAISGDTVVVGAWGDDDNGESSGSAYVFRRDQGGPGAWGQVAKITPADGAEKDYFGFSVAVSGTNAVISTRRPKPYSHDDSGSAYVFERDRGGPDGWEQAARLDPDDGTDDDEFGYSVAISGGTAIVGARYDDVNGQKSGSAYVFQRDQGGPGAWGQASKIVPSDGRPYDRFGESVAIDDDTVVIGAFVSDETGSAYIFRRDHGGPGAWGEVAEVTPDAGLRNSAFGYSVSISDETAVIGAVGEDDPHVDAGAVYVFERDRGGPDAWGRVVKHPCPPVFGATRVRFGSSVSLDRDILVVGAPDGEGRGPVFGSAYVFRLDPDRPSSWERVAEITPDDLSHTAYFGIAVAVEGDTLIVGASRDDGVPRGSGSAHIFERHRNGPEAWGQVAKLLPEAGVDVHLFGSSVAISGDTVIVGAPNDWVNGPSSGSAYIFERHWNGPDTWGQVAKLVPADGEQFDKFGSSVAISGDTAVVGAAEDDDIGDRAGSAYIFERNRAGSDSWGQVSKITPDDDAWYDFFGAAVAINRDTVVVGAHGDKDNGLNSGSVSLFGRNQGGPGAWGRIAKIIPDDNKEHDRFGHSVSMRNETVVVGANDIQCSGPGSAYVFSRDTGGSGAWGQVAKIVATDGFTCKGFGSSVAAGSEAIAVGAPGDDDLGYGSGTAYVFSRTRVRSSPSEPRRVVPQP